MASDNRRTVPGSSPSLSAEERWKQYRPDGGFGGESGGVQDDETEAKTKGPGNVGKKGAPAKGAPVTPAAAGPAPAATIGAAPPAATVLPSSESAAVHPELAQETTLAASTLPVTTRQATVAASTELTAEATPLSQSVDKLSDDLAAGVTDPATLTQDIQDYKAAMEAAGQGDKAADGLKIMMDAAHLPDADASAVNALAMAQGIDVAAAGVVTLEQAQEQLTADLADDTIDAGLVDLHVMQIKNLTGDDQSGQTASDVIGAAVAASGGNSTNALAALYAAAAKNGVDLSQDSEEKVGAALDKKAAAQGERAGKKAQEEQQKAAAAAAQQQRAQQQGGGEGGSGSSVGSAGTSEKAPTYDAEAVNSPHGTQENLSNWTQQVYPKGQFNNEQQHYTDGGQNVTFNADGSATLTAKNEGNGNWSSARITGDPIGELPKYIEATLTAPSGQGSWPAFWLVGPGSWPQGGEVDIMERVNGENTLHTSNHWGADGVGSAGEMPGWSPTHAVEGLDMNQPHRYGAMLTQEGVQFYLDGKKIGDPVVYPPESNWPKIASEMVPVANIAMGGTWPGNVPADLPDQQMKISIRRSTTAPDDPNSQA